MSDRIQKYLSDILTCIEFIEIEIQTVKNFKEYQNNRLLRAATERQFEIIGEALSQALKIDPELPLTNKLRIVGMRNRIIHAYDAVDEIMIWEVIKKHLPLLKFEVHKLLAN
jgi:uncharacterized protein with HEPN domain